LDDIIFYNVPKLWQQLKIQHEIKFSLYYLMFNGPLFARKLRQAVRHRGRVVEGGVESGQLFSKMKRKLY
jgi:hypothetical protein